MQTEKPTKLINLLIELRDEQIKTNYEAIYLKIFNEIMDIEFEHNPKEIYDWVLYKKLVQLSVRDFVYLGQTTESTENLNWVISYLEDTSILVR